MSEAAVDVSGLCVARGGREVLRDIGFRIETGTVTGLIGPSGGGKTTLMRALVGVQAGVTGQVTVLGEPAGSPGLRRRVAYVTQSPAVYADLSVRENLDYFADMLAAERTQVDKAIERVALDGVPRQLVGSLSGGQRARVSLAVALLGQPELLVLDEPTVGLDPVLRRDLWALFASLAAEGATLLVSSHVMDEAERCERLILLRDGQLIAHDGVASLLARTRTRSVEEAFLALVAAEGSGQ